MSEPISVPQAIQLRIEAKARSLEITPDAFRSKVGDELSALKRAAQALSAISERLGIAEVLRLEPGGARITVLVRRNGVFEVLKLSGNPDRRDGLKGEGATYEAISRVSPRAPIARLVNFGRDSARGVDFVLTGYINRNRYSQRAAGVENQVQTDFPTTRELLGGLRDVPTPSVIPGDYAKFKSFRQDHLGGPIADTTPLLRAATHFASIVADTSVDFNAAVRELAADATFAGLGDCKATNVFEGPIFFDPDGTLLPPGFTEAQLIAESGVTDDYQVGTLIEDAVSTATHRLRTAGITAMSEVQVRRNLLLGIGVLNRIYAGYGLGNAEKAIRGGDNAASPGQPNVSQRLKRAKSCFLAANGIAAPRAQ